MKKFLFIGNSATYVNKIPETLALLAGDAGFDVAVTSIVKGGYELARHADPSDEYGAQVAAEIGGGYDAVFLQDNGSCITSDEKRAACRDACRTLARAAQASGAKVYIYVRPPYGKRLAELSSFEQCRELDVLFTDIAREIGAECVFVNRAFAHAIKEGGLELWGDDNAHTSRIGGYLAVCTFFATLFDASASTLDACGFTPEQARAVWEIADKVALRGEGIPTLTDDAALDRA